MYTQFCKLFKHLPNQNSYRLIHKYVFNMEKAYLRHLEGSEQFQITFQYSNPELKVNRQFNFCRQLKENVSVFLGRVVTNVEKVVSKKNKKKKGESSSESSNPGITVQLNLNGTQVSGDVTCAELFKEDCNSNIVLKLLDKEYSVVINSPWVDTLALPTSVLANFPVYPSKFETVFTEKNISEFRWSKSLNKANWTDVGTGFVYVPKNEDINSYLKVSCIPKNEKCEGPIAETVCDVQVDASPGFCPFENRHQFTKEKATGKKFRVVTYNILADLYCDSDFSRTALFPYCPPYALNIDYRKQLILKELIGYNADVVCLQELDRKVYFHDVEPVFSSLNYDSTFQLKGGSVAEGLACIFNKNRFKLLETNSIILGEQLDNNPIFADVWEKVALNEKLAERVLQRTTAVQATALESTEHDEVLVVANTHLYFHPDADHIRLLQGGLAMRYVIDIIEKLKQKTNKRISLIFCGDFNSTPECGIYQLYTSGKVLENCIDWESNKEEAVKNVNFEQPYQLASACGTPQFTNYTSGFAGCLDYIYYDKTKLEVTQVIPLPSNEEIMEHTALPSIVFPSDHISLVSDLQWV